MNNHLRNAIWAASLILFGIMGFREGQKHPLQAPKEVTPEPTGFYFTNQQLISDWMEWQVSEGLMHRSTNPPNSNALTFDYVWINDESAARFAVWIGQRNLESNKQTENDLK